MTTQEVMERYPGAVNAVELFEKLTEWDMFRRCAAEEGVPTLKSYLKRDATTAANRATDSRREVLAVVLTEMDHADFDTYLAAKLGAM